MYYKHLFAVFAAAFFLCVGVISAQNQRKTFTFRQAKSIIKKDALRAYQLAQDQQFNRQQLAYFIEYEDENRHNFTRINGLLGIYWQQLSLDEKIDYSNIHFVDAYFYSNDWYEAQTYFSPVFLDMIANPEQYKKGRNATSYQNYITDKLVAPCIRMPFDRKNLAAATDLTQNTALNDYISQVRVYAPEYEAQVLAYFTCYRVLAASKDTATYLNALNNYLRTYETNSSNLYEKVMFVIRTHYDSKEQLNNALVWLDKANTLLPNPRFEITKAHIFYLLDEYEKAQSLITAVKERIFLTDEHIMDYYDEIAAIINKK